MFGQGGETADYIGAVRVFGIADKILFEELVKLDNVGMTMCAHHSLPSSQAAVLCHSHAACTSIAGAGS